MSNIIDIRNRVIDAVKHCENEQTLKAICTILREGKMEKGRKIEKVKSNKPRVSKPGTATEIKVIEYKFGDADRIALQTNGKPNDQVLSTLRELKAEGLGSFYMNVKENPFGEGPFWSFKKTETVVSAVTAIQQAMA